MKAKIKTCIAFSMLCIILTTLTLVDYTSNIDLKEVTIDFKKKSLNNSSTEEFKHLYATSYKYKSIDSNFCTQAYDVKVKPSMIVKTEYSSKKPKVLTIGSCRSYSYQSKISQPEVNVNSNIEILSAVKGVSGMDLVSSINPAQTRAFGLPMKPNSPYLKSPIGGIIPLLILSMLFIVYKNKG